MGARKSYVYVVPANSIRPRDTLKARDWRLIQLLAEGATNAEIGKAVGTTQSVIKNYLRVIYDKLGLSSRLEVALWYMDIGHEKQ